MRQAKAQAFPCHHQQGSTPAHKRQQIKKAEVRAEVYLLNEVWDLLQHLTIGLQKHALVPGTLALLTHFTTAKQPSQVTAENKRLRLSASICWEAKYNNGLPRQVKAQHVLVLHIAFADQQMKATHHQHCKLHKRYKHLLFCFEQMWSGGNLLFFTSFLICTRSCKFCVCTILVDDLGVAFDSCITYKTDTIYHQADKKRKRKKYASPCQFSE